MKLRPFVPEDRTDFLDMCADFYSGEAALKPIPSAQMKATFDAVISGSPYVRGFILDQDGNAAGYGLVYPFYSNEAGGLCLMLDEIYVRPEFQGRGFDGVLTVPKQLVMAIRGAAAFGPEAVGLKLEICPRNPRARALYERSGFSVLGYDSMIKPLQ